MSVGSVDHVSVGSVEHVLVGSAERVSVGSVEHVWVGSEQLMRQNLRQKRIGYLRKILDIIKHIMVSVRSILTCYMFEKAFSCKRETILFS